MRLLLIIVLLTGNLLVIFPISAYSQIGIDQLNQQLQNQHFNGVVATTSFLMRISNKTGDIKGFNEFHNYLWYKNNLHFQIEGTGKVYKILTENKIKRIDSTNFDGYNFGAFNFVYNDTLFSLGGYGYWNYNGSLRFFEEKTGEWNIIPTNITVPIMIHRHAKPYFDLAHHAIYFIYQNPEKIEDRSYQKDDTYYVQCLNLQTKTWWDEPKLMNQSIVQPERIYFYPIPFHTQYGMIIRYHNDLLLFDMNNNTYLQIQQNKVNEINAKLHINSNELLTYTIQQKLFFYYPQSGLIDSTVLLPTDLIQTNIPVFFNKSKIHQLYYNPTLLAILISSVLILSIIGGALYKIKRLNKRVATLMGSHMHNGHKNVPEIYVANPNSFRENLTEVEKSLLDLLIANTTKNDMTSVTQMNQVLGIANKDTKIQNNIRSNAIQLINRKFNAYSGLSDELIEKQRTEFDKRFFEYQIQRKYLSKVKIQK